MTMQLDTRYLAGNAQVQAEEMQVLSQRARAGHTLLPLYKSRGLHVFETCSVFRHWHEPASRDADYCPKRGKRPLVKDWPSLADRAMSDAEYTRLRRAVMATNRQSLETLANWAIAIPAGIVVFDFDTPEGFERARAVVERASIPCWISRSRRGGHVWFRDDWGTYPNGAKFTLIIDDTEVLVDIRAAGRGCVIVAPSLTVDAEADRKASAVPPDVRVGLYHWEVFETIEREQLQPPPADWTQAVIDDQKRPVRAVHSTAADTRDDEEDLDTLTRVDWDRVMQLPHAQDEGHYITACCPACREEGRDSVRPNVTIYKRVLKNKGFFTCHSRKKAHNQAIWQAIERVPRSSGRSGPAATRGNAPMADELARLTVVPRHAASAPDEFQLPDHRDFPLDGFPKPIRDYIRSLQDEYPSDYLAGAVLGILAGGVGNRLNISPDRCQAGEDVEPDIWEEPANLFCVLVGEPGARKSPAMNRLLKSVESLEQQERAIYQEQLERWQYEVVRSKANKEAPPAQPRQKRYIVRDATTEALTELLERNSHGLLAHYDEGAQWMLSFDQYRKGAGGDRPIWLGMWSSQNVTVDRKTRPGLYVVHPSLSLIAGVQPDILPTFQLDHGRNDGMLDRILWVLPSDRHRQSRRGTPIPAAIADAFHQLVKKIYESPARTDEHGFPDPPICVLADDARAEYEAFWQYLQWLMSDQCPRPEVRGVASKMEGQVLRIALALHYARHHAGEEDRHNMVSADTMRRATEIAMYFLATWLEVMDLIRESPETRRLTQLAQFIVKNRGGSTTAREMQQSKQAKTARQAHALLERMVARGLGHFEYRKAKTGPSTKVFVVDADRLD